jgi:pimeloyl-ACP methyl ester carboxylesterase
VSDNLPVLHETRRLPPQPGSSELRELGRLALHELAGAARGIGGIHQAVADRAFGLSGPGATPARVIHDTITRGVYAGVSGGARLAGHAAAVALPERAITDHPRGAAVVAAVNGLIGDALEEQGSPLAHPMHITRGGTQVTGDVVIFVHGLMETEHSWGLGGRTPYGERLPGWTPLYVRYNSGRRISRNGHALCEALCATLADWPVEVERIALVGHSMGGLVARAACHCASERGDDWVTKVSHVVSLGTPHLGAPLEQGVHKLAGLLSRLPETAPVAGFLRRRSGGIRDLRQGSLVDADWEGRDPEDLRAEAVAEVPLLAHATHCFVSACVTRSPKHPVGRLVGDLLVLGPSASGTSKRRSIGLDAANGMELGGANHFALLNHPAVHDRLANWLAVPSTPPV